MTDVATVVAIFGLGLLAGVVILGLWWRFTNKLESKEAEKKREVNEAKLSARASDISVLTDSGALERLNESLARERDRNQQRD